MRAAKLILGFLMLLGVSKEYIHAGRQLYTFFDPGILLAVSLMLVPCAWLLANGFSKERVAIRSARFSAITACRLSCSWRWPRSAS